jgi:hypothetical protein
MFKGLKTTREKEDYIKGFAEVVSNIVKRHYGLPSESNKFNIASLGIDKEKIAGYSKTILNFANKFITGIDNEGVNSNTIAEAYIRKIIRKTISEYKF